MYARIALYQIHVAATQPVWKTVKPDECGNVWYSTVEHDMLSECRMLQLCSKGLMLADTICFSVSVAMFVFGHSFSS